MQGSAIWGAVTSDRQKRLLLVASINSVGKRMHKEFPRLASDVTYVTNRANSLEDKRNNVIHSPLSEITNALFAALTKRQMGEVYPSGLWNERAKKLAATIKGKDLLAVITSYRDYALKLASFSDEIFTAWNGPSESWPERPKLPPLKDSV